MTAADAAINADLRNAGSMSANQKDLGRLLSVYGVAPQHLQRAAIITVLSFLFFMGTMLMMYFRQLFLYFLLATGFLIVYLVMMFSLYSMRRAVVRLYERGLEFRKHRLLWTDIA